MKKGRRITVQTPDWSLSQCSWFLAYICLAGVFLRVFKYETLLCNWRKCMLRTLRCNSLDLITSALMQSRSFHWHSEGIWMWTLQKCFFMPFNGMWLPKSIMRSWKAQIEVTLSGSQMLHQLSASLWSNTGNCTDRRMVNCCPSKAVTFY